MKITERRKNLRNSPSNTSVFIQIKHSFGPIKKSVYKVNEYNEFGLSFFVPFKDGYFLVGTPIDFYLIKPDKSRKHYSGIVKYYHPYYNEIGKKYYKIGLETSSIYRDLTKDSYTLRPNRFTNINTKSRQYILFTINNQNLEFDLIDFSKYSAAFYCKAKEYLFLNVSSILNEVEIYYHNKIIFKGSATITRIYHDKSDKRRIIIEPKNKLIDINEYENITLVNRAIEESKNLINCHDSYNNIDPKFKSLVADLRCFLDDYKKYLESPIIQSKQEMNGDLLNELFPEFYRKMDEKIVKIDKIVTNLKLSQDDHLIYKSYYQKQLHNLILLAPIIHRSFYKPEGYPGDYEMMKIITENKYEGNTLLAKLIHKYSTTIPPANLVRRRNRYLAKRILNFVKESKRSKVEILSIASGPSLEIDILMKNHVKETNKISLSLLDQEIHALQFSQDKLYENRIKYESEMDIIFIHKTLGIYLKDSLKPKSKRYDLIYAFGVFDYFDEDIAKFVIKSLIPKLNPEGKLIISNVSLDNMNYRYLSEFGMDWYLIYRNRKELIELSNGRKNIKNIKIDQIEKGMMKFLEMDV